MFLSKERTTLEKSFPGLDEALLEIPLMEMEIQSHSGNQGNQAIKLFRKFGGSGLLIPVKYGGMGVSPLQAIQIQRALGSRSPSLAVATTMHHYTVAIIQEMISDESGFALLEHVADQNLYFSSGFAEGRTGSNIFESRMQVKPASGGLIISGSKKPCTLSISMDFMTASVLLPKREGKPDEAALVVIPANSPGIERHSFWGTLALTGTESHEVRLNEVYVHKDYIYNMGDPSQLGQVVSQAFIWFELLVSAAYLGIASSLIERTLVNKKGVSSERVALATEVEGGMSALQGLACSMMNGEKGDSVVAQALFVRFLVQNIIERITTRAAEILGGMAFITSPEVAYLLASARALAFHPPSRLSVVSGLDNYLFGEPLQI
jgi:alkylation response protein AidB-like acyl-CoA dehydrogenase